MEQKTPPPPEPRAHPRTECIACADDLSRVAGAWDDLARRTPGASVFQTATWLATWLRHHPDAEPVISFVRRGERLTAALPLCKHGLGIGPVRVLVLRFAADNDSDYCDALSDPEYPGDLAALWSDVMARGGWHLLDLRYVPSASSLGGLVASCYPLRVACQTQDLSPYLDLSRDWRESVTRGQRAEVLRRRRRLGELGDVRFDVAANDAEIDVMLRQLAGLHRARWDARGETSMFHFPGYHVWLGDVCRDLMRRGELYLCRLAVDADPVSMGLYFLWQRRILCYTSVFSEAYSRYGPVHLLIMAVVEDARARGLARVHDFGRGSEEYKMRWTQQTQALNRFLVARGTLKGTASFMWGAHAKPFLWRHQRLGTALREARRRAALRRERRAVVGSAG